MKLTLKNISLAYGVTKILHDISAEAESGQFIIIVGPNGSGKSSLLKAIAGLLPFEGQTNIPKNRSVRSRAIAYLAQDATAPERRLVKDITALGRTPHIGALGRLSEADQSIIDDSLARCDISEFSDRFFGSLSGGEKMRVHLARSFATQAPLLLADEPITALDPYYQLAVLDDLKAYSHDGRTVVAALHDLTLARKYADRIWVLNEGRLIQNNTPEKALDAKTLAEVFRIRPDGSRL